VNATQSAPSDPLIILTTKGAPSTILHHGQGRVVFHQGDPADSVFYIERGSVELAVVSHAGRHGVVGVLRAREFFGEECLAGDSIRLTTAKTVSPSSLMKTEKAVMQRVLHEAPSVAEFFTACLLSRNLRLQEDLIDQLLNSSEKRLARALLLLAGMADDGKLQAVIPKVSQETLAEMIGTSRQRVNFFMNKFRQSGFIAYDDCTGQRVLVHSSLLNVVLND